MSICLGSVFVLSSRGAFLVLPLNLGGPLVLVSGSKGNALVWGLWPVGWDWAVLEVCLFTGGGCLCRGLLGGKYYPLVNYIMNYL